MKKNVLRRILTLTAEGSLSPDEALEQTYVDSVRATLAELTTGITLDLERETRTGIGEVVFAQGKSEDMLLAAVEGLSLAGPALASRVSAAQGLGLTSRFPEGDYWPQAGLFAVNAPARFANAIPPPWPQSGDILIVSAGASDMPVALEAFGSLAFLNRNAGLVTDVGVAGLHRLMPHIAALRKAKAVIAVAGMEGALPGVLAGLTKAPVIAVPTSTGYGVGADGFAALSTMLCTCVPGVAVVNIDNGFGAAAFAAKIPLTC